MYDWVLKHILEAAAAPSLINYRNNEQRIVYYHYFKVNNSLGPGQRRLQRLATRLPVDHGLESNSLLEECRKRAIGFASSLSCE